MDKIFPMQSCGDGESHYPVAVAVKGKRVRKRRSWTIEEKLAIVAEVETSGDPVAVVARRHDMNANHLFNWIARVRAGTLERKRGRKPGVQAHSPRRAGLAPDPEQEFIDLGIFTREQMVQAMGAETLMEIELPGPLRVRVPLWVEPELLIRTVRALRAV